jgi:hypothetical protein
MLHSKEKWEPHSGANEELIGGHSGANERLINL